MKGRESGMPGEQAWQEFFDVECIITRLECVKQHNASIVEFGCGYGTFTVPVAGRTTGTVHAIDIVPSMVELVRSRARMAGLANVHIRISPTAVRITTDF